MLNARREGNLRLKPVTQKIQIIEPGTSLLGHIRTFVFQELGDPKDQVGLENIFCILTIWAPEDDVLDIYHHCTKMLVKHFQSKLDGVSVQIRYNNALSEVNKALKQLDIYYAKNKKRFHVEGIIGVVLPTQAWLSSCGESQAYLCRENGCKKLFNESNHQKPNIFHRSVIVNTQINDHIILTSSRFSDRVPKTILQNFISSENQRFEQFKNEIVSLESSNLAAISITLKVVKKTAEEPIAPDTKTISRKINNSSRLETFKHVYTLVISRIGKVGKKIFQPIGEAFKLLWNMLWSKYINTRPLLSLTIFSILVVIVITLISYFVIYNPHNQSLHSNYMQMQKELTLIESLSSSNKTLALQNINKLRDSINNLPPKDRQAINSIESKAKQPTLDDLLAKIVVIEDKINNVYRLTPVEVYSSSKEAKYTVSAILGDNLYTVDTLSGDVLAINIKGSTSKIIASKPELKFAENISTGSVNTLLISVKNDIYQVTTSGEVTKQANTSGNWPTSKEITTFANSLYLLSPENDQIYKFSKLTNGYGPKSNYIKNSSAGLLNGASGMAINGGVFVSLESGNILYFNQGIQKDFSVTNPPTDMQNINGIAFSEDPDKLILLNTSKSAFIVLTVSDTGAQYDKEVVVNETTDISSFVLSNNNKDVYFTTNKSVYKLTIF